ncbi:MAG: chemotaxis-specific protein-glutamate methyltransferase CheB [Gemmatimonadetes bacterium]|nr:chemotaxis-specific protein-glutamate methyltransferase CheB [Gemmatimonadota bacterium]
MIRVLIAEDSPTIRALLVAIIGADPELQVVGEARTGTEAVEMALRLRPNLITMDVNMPVMGGLEATREIMIHAPTPILIVSSRADQAQVQLSLDALAAGALMVMPTPDNPRSPHFADRADQLRSMVRAMSQVKVVRRWRPRSEPVRPPVNRGAGPEIRLVAIAASTGGPAALHEILCGLPRDFPLPIVVVQHIATDFVGGLARWLTASCGRPVTVARGGERLDAGRILLAPDHRHLGIGSDRRTILSDVGPVGGFRPSANYLFESAARAFGNALAAVILTGMGRDGVDGLRAVRAAGGLVLAQDESTSVVYGMPGEAVAARLVDAVLPIHEIAPRLVVELASGAGR